MFSSCYDWYLIIASATTAKVYGFPRGRIYLFNVHRYNTCENDITKGNNMPLTGDKSTMVASMHVTLPISN